MCILDIECGHILCFLTVILFLAVPDSVHTKRDHDSISKLHTVNGSCFPVTPVTCTRG